MTFDALRTIIFEQTGIPNQLQILKLWAKKSDAQDSGYWPLEYSHKGGFKYKDEQDKMDDKIIKNILKETVLDKKQQYIAII